MLVIKYNAIILKRIKVFNETINFFMNNYLLDLYTKTLKQLINYYCIGVFI